MIEVTDDGPGAAASAAVIRDGGVGRILTKLRLRDRAHAVIYGYETGLVRPGEGGAPGT